jgi:Ca2+-dependent lipid-binding protein
LQLTPDPPFFSLCTMTFLGQPKVDLSCSPLVKKGLNIMDLPVISNFVQGAVDAAMAEYVAPKSLTVDLKEMLVGDDFKKDTIARGILVVRIKRAIDFKEGDSGIGPFKQGSTDGYVTVGWAKFGKAVWSTRVIQADMHPVWEETAYVIVTPQELNVHERLRVQLWDSDRVSADDDLGRIEVDLNEIMSAEKSKDKMWDREDGFRALKAGEAMPGKLAWSVGYFPKTKLLDEQLKNSDEESDIKTVEELKEKVYQESGRKLREASKDESEEIEKQKKQDFKARQTELIIASPPPKEYPSGILSIVIHQIQGLELEAFNKRQADEEETASDEKEAGGDLPSSYCSIILNHQKIYKTRTKPKNAQPFFNAGTERFVPDIHKAHVHISVRDSRVHEDDPLIGIVDLPLSQIFEKRSQINDFWPLGGGLGFGQIRISMVFRSVELTVPREMLGWEYGTLEIDPDIKGNVPEDIQNCKIKASTAIGYRKFHPKAPNTWRSKTDKAIHLAVKKRYSSCVTLEFRSRSSLKNKTPAFAVLWLRNIPDDEDQTITLPVWTGDVKRARSNACEEFGDKVGEIGLKLKLWSGLSGYHIPLAKSDPNIEDVMEVLDCANDVNDEENMGGEDGSDSNNSSDDEGSETSSTAEKLLGVDSDLGKDGKRGVMNEIEDYRKNRKQLHRRNRGLMQWKVG